MATKGTDWLIALAAVFIAVIFVMGALGVDMKGLIGTKSVAPDVPTSGQIGTYCGSDKTTFTFTAKDKYNAGAAGSSGAEWAVFVNGIKKDGAYTTGDSMTLAPGQKVDMYLYDSTATHSDGGMTSANTMHKYFVVPCTGSLDDTIDVIDYGTATSNTATWPSAGSATILDDSYASVKGVTSGISIPAGGSKSLGKLELIYENKKGYGSADGKNCIVFMANKTVVKSLVLTGPGVEDVACKPDAFVIDEGVIGAGYQEYYDWKIPVFESNKLQNFGLTIELESDADATASTGIDDIVFYIYDQQWFYNSLSGKMELGYEDENNVLIGADIIGENITLA